MRHGAQLGFALIVLGACAPAPSQPSPPPPPPAVAAGSASTTASQPHAGPPPTGVVFDDMDRIDLRTEYAFSPDGSLIAMERAPHEIVLYGTKTGDQRAVVATPGDVLDIGFRADGRAFWAVCALGAAAWEVSGAPIFAVEARSVPEKRTAAWSPSGDRLAVLDARSELRVLDGRTAAVVWKADAGNGARLVMWGKASDVVVTEHDGAHKLERERRGAPRRAAALVEVMVVS